jgi:two-component system cell cycle response regulator
MALSFSLVEGMRGKGSGSFDYQTYWRRSLTTACAARLIAERIAPPLRDDAFVGGLLSDIGMLAALHCAPDEYAPAVGQFGVDGQTPQDVERSLFGFDHTRLSQSLLRIWQFPDVLVEAVAIHHETAADGSRPRDGMTQCLQTAAVIADLFCQHVESRHLDSTRQTACRWTGLPQSDVDALLEALDKQVRDAASLFSLDIGQTHNYADIRENAAIQLARLSLTAELERAEAAQKVEAFQEKTQQLEQRANTDALTRVANRAGFNDRLLKAFNGAAQGCGQVGLIMLDVDHFKRLNDTYGHQTGDAVLSQVGSCLKSIESKVRFAARYGGDEFAILVSDATGETVRALAEEVHRAIESMVVRADGRELRVTASFGATVVSPGADQHTPDTLVRQADQLLYRAKENGRNRVSFG